MSTKTLSRLIAASQGKIIGDFCLCNKHIKSVRYDYDIMRDPFVTVVTKKIVDDPNDYTEGDYCELCEEEKQNEHI